MRKLIILSFLLFISATQVPILEIKDLPSEETVSTHPIWDHQNKYIKIRGFWYPLLEEGKGVLSSRPDLKSCCVGSSLMVGQQIFVNGDLTGLDPGRVVTLTGNFSINPLYNKEGKLTQLYVLDHAQLISSTSFSFLFFIGAFAVITVIAFCYWTYSRSVSKRKNK